MFRQLIGVLLLLSIFFGLASAVETYGPFESDTGRWIMPAENLGAPWFHNEKGPWFGDSKKASLYWDSTNSRWTFWANNKIYFDCGNVVWYTSDPANESINFGNYPIVASGGITGTASRIAVGNFIDTSYGLKNSTANKAQINLAADKGLEFGTGGSLGALQAKAGNGIELGAGGIAAKAEDASIAVGSSGIKVGASKIHLNAIAGGSAGNHTLTGAAVGDEVDGVLYVTKTGGNLVAVTDITSEFSGTGKGIIDTNVLANGGGTDTSGGYLIVAWLDRTA